MGNNQDDCGVKLFRWEDIAAEKMNPLLERQFVTGEKAMLARIMLKRGCVVPEHAHHNEQISFIVSGALEFLLDGTPQIVRAGEILVIPAGVRHSATALEDTEDLDIFAPPRQDWLDRTDDYLRQTSDAATEPRSSGLERASN